MEIGPWNILDTGKGSPEDNMAIDAALLEEQATSGNANAILHLYDWDRPCATYGHFIDPFALLSEEGIATFPLGLAKRPTGGGIIFHVTDWAFSIVVPSNHLGYSVNVLENYAFVNKIVIKVIEKFLGSNENFSLLPTDPISVSQAKHFCMAKPTKYDVMLNGLKVGGGAQRRTKHAFLHQGTLSLAFPPEKMLIQVLKDKSDVVESMKKNTFSLLPGNPTQTEIFNARTHLKSCFAQTVNISS